MSDTQEVAGSEGVGELPSTLTPREIRAMAMSAYDDMTHPEIARRMRCSERTVRNVLASARRKLGEAGLTINPRPRPTTISVDPAALDRLIGEKGQTYRWPRTTKLDAPRE